MIINQIVSGGGSSVAEPYVEFSKAPGLGYTKLASTTSRIIDLSGVTNIDVGLMRAYADNTFISGKVDMSDIQIISGMCSCYQMFKGCTGITSVDLSSLSKVPAYYGTSEMFMGCTGITTVDISSLSEASNTYACKSMFEGCTGITGVLDLSGFQWNISSNACTNMFKGCTGITSVNLSGLYGLSYADALDSMFENCTGLTSVDLSGLRSVAATYSSTVSNRMFYGCSSLASVDISSLNSVTSGSALARMFMNCTSLQTISFDSLQKITGTSAFFSMFTGCTSLTSVYFPRLNSASFAAATNQFNLMLSGVTGCTVHFPSNMQATMSSWSDVINGFGGTNTTVLFDLLPTVALTGADSKTYTRNPKFDTSSALAWYAGAYGSSLYNTPAYYTSGTVIPSVGDTIYSDSACTTAVTTISTIA